MFVSNERRKGPFDRRGMATRIEARANEQEKIEKLKAFKAKDRTAVPTAPLFTKKRLAFLGLALLLIIIAALMAT